ncbi:MAG: aminotransferase class IV [Chloroflexi bacterium]|nr:aminotransferase class IV [Chloroflexota bacterium]
MRDYMAYFNGEWVPFSRVMIHPHDRGFTMSDVVFDMARTFNGKPFLLGEHVDRLYRSLKYLRLDPGLSLQEMTEISYDAVRRNEHYRAEVGDFRITQFVTRGTTHGGDIHKVASPTVCVNVEPVAFEVFARLYVEGAHAIIVRTRSYTSDVVEPKVKHQSRLNFVLADLEARDVDPQGMPLLLDRDGNVTEGRGYNVFLVSGGVLKTPTDRSVLQGITRGFVMTLARQLGIPLAEEDLQPYDLYTADEVFFTRTSPGISPVSQVDGRHIGDEIPGPVTRHLLAAYSERVGLDIVDQALRFAGMRG